MDEGDPSGFLSTQPSKVYLGTIFVDCYRKSFGGKFPPGFRSRSSFQSFESDLETSGLRHISLRNLTKVSQHGQFLDFLCGKLISERADV